MGRISMQRSNSSCLAPHLDRIVNEINNILTKIIHCLRLSIYGIGKHLMMLAAAKYYFSLLLV
jgi:hypothetical protein